MLIFNVLISIILVSQLEEICSAPVRNTNIVIKIRKRIGKQSKMSRRKFIVTCCGRSCPSMYTKQIEEYDYELATSMLPESSQNSLVSKISPVPAALNNSAEYYDDEMDDLDLGIGNFSYPKLANPATVITISTSLAPAVTTAQTAVRPGERYYHKTTRTTPRWAITRFANPRTYSAFSHVISTSPNMMKFQGRNFHTTKINNFNYSPMRKTSTRKYNNINRNNIIRTTLKPILKQFTTYSYSHRVSTSLRLSTVTGKTPQTILATKKVNNNIITGIQKTTIKLNNKGSSTLKILLKNNKQSTNARIENTTSPELVTVPSTITETITTEVTEPATLTTKKQTSVDTPKLITVIKTTAVKITTASILPSTTTVKAAATSLKSIETSSSKATTVKVVETTSKEKETSTSSSVENKSEKVTEKSGDEDEVEENSETTSSKKLEETTVATKSESKPEEKEKETEEKSEGEDEKEEKEEKPKKDTEEEKPNEKTEKTKEGEEEKTTEKTEEEKEEGEDEKSSVKEEKSTTVKEEKSTEEKKEGEEENTSDKDEKSGGEKSETEGDTKEEAATAESKTENPATPAAKETSETEAAEEPSDE